ncbi:hypothetical protein PISMIDRAFT_677154 [Pisolithus microcarpus 441]|uniref:Uncharacterized protein n=1 Tax=Pisolithus microcarpus 441 TaxID=765257 RepID=A0A0C9Z8B1_9AGAM|nr:hypothetical protein PISMIDRAFT_677154 [Pisolithus microcarpus 441]
MVFSMIVATGLERCTIRSPCTTHVSPKGGTAHAFRCTLPVILSFLDDSRGGCTEQRMVHTPLCM